jgi:hypothetical protein
LNDEIIIDVKENIGIISGSNPRSVLIAAYRFLEEAGCRWVSPGEKGEILPFKDICDITVNVSEKASYRHRGICIEGTVSYENIRDMLDWMPKVGFNSYFIQFRGAYVFLKKMVYK